MIIGIKRLEEQFDKLSEVELRKGVSKAINHVQTAAQENCGFRFPTGELKGSILTDVQSEGDMVVGFCYTNKAYAPYVEFGTGPKGQENHKGISPDVAVAYRQTPWWIHENKIDRRAAEAYGWIYIDTDEGRFYYCGGQAAQPFMYPALKNNEEAVVEIIADSIRSQL